MFVRLLIFAILAFACGVFADVDVDEVSDSLTRPTFIALAPTAPTAFAYVTNNNGTSLPHIFKVNLVSGVHTQIDQDFAFQSLHQLDVDSAERFIYVGDGYLNHVYRVSIADGSVTMVDKNYAFPPNADRGSPVALDNRDSPTYLYHAVNSQLFKITLGSGLVMTVGLSGGLVFGRAYGLAIDPPRNLALISDADNGHIYRVLLGSGSMTQVDTDDAYTVSGAGQVALDGSGTFAHVASLDGYFRRLDIASGASSLVYNFGTRVTGAAPVPNDDGTYYVVTPTTKKIWKVRIFLPNACTNFPPLPTQAGVAGTCIGKIPDGGYCQMGCMTGWALANENDARYHCDAGSFTSTKQAKCYPVYCQEGMLPGTCKPTPPATCRCVYW